NRDRVSAGKQPLRSVLWQDDRTKATNRKYPQVSFVQWSKAVTALQEQSEYSLAHVSTRELVQHVRRDESLLAHLVQTAMLDREARASVLSLVCWVEPVVTSLRTQVTQNIDQLASMLLDVALRDGQWVERLIEQAVQDDVVLARLLEWIEERHEPTVHE